MQSNSKNELSLMDGTPLLCSELLTQWQAEVNLYKEMPNPVWEISGKLVKQLFVIASRLPCYAGGIPNIDPVKCSGCVISSCEGKLLTASNGHVLLIEDNIIRIKKDEDRAIENKILSSAPDEVYREIWMHI